MEQPKKRRRPKMTDDEKAVAKAKRDAAALQRQAALPRSPLGGRVQVKATRDGKSVV